MKCVQSNMIFSFQDSILKSPITGVKKNETKKNFKLFWHERHPLFTPFVMTENMQDEGRTTKLSASV